MKKHKYFRDLEYKEKLEHRYDEKRGRYCGRSVYFLTEDVDTRFIREEWHHVLRFDNTYRAKHLFEKNSNSNRFIYWDRPEVDYTVHEYLYKKESRKTFFKKYDNRVFRRKMKKCENILPSGGEYKKYCYAWWY